MSRTEAERQARREDDRRRSQEAAKRLLSSEGWARWLRVRRHFHAYSLANQLLIAAQCPHASRVCGFKAWLKLGYCVRRGETALRIWAPVPPSRQALRAWREAGGETKDKPRVRFRLTAVFDVSQVDPLPPPAYPVPLEPPVRDVEGDDLAWARPLLEALAGDLGCRVVDERLPDSIGGFFHPQLMLIGLNDRRAVNHHVKTLVHELAHALIHLERNQDDPVFGPSAEEVIVESVAFTVCGSLGLDTSGYSIPYLASWGERGDLAMVELAAGTIDRLAKRIEDAVLLDTA